VTDRRDSVIASAQTLILAAGHDMRRLGAMDSPALVSVRGQVTHLPPSESRSLAAVVCGDGYVAPLPDGGLCVGATFQPNDADETLRAPDHAQNLARLERMLPGFGTGLGPAALGGRAAVRAATADRLPACGRLSAGVDRCEGADGVHVVTGLGARGLIFAPLCAEVLGAHLAGEPNPIERRLTRALDPARLVAREHGSLESRR
jgi:tRNA 5-methylaminomethyl-2-thiouridine biosynthesis bifunctional protein